MPKFALMALAFVVIALGGAAAQESREPIRIAVHDWTGQQLTARLAAGVLERNGYRTRFVVTDYLAGLDAVVSGRVDLVTEQWDTTAQGAMRRAEATGKVERLGALGPPAFEGWWYPAYMKERCPGLPDWRALRGCAAAFATPDTAPKGRYLGLPGLWGGFDAERIAALGLPFVVVDAANEAAMYADLQDAYARKAPLMVWVYRPHWVTSKFAGEFVHFPDYEPACYLDPKWGVNPERSHDCEKPSGAIWKYASVEFARKWPKAHRILQRFHIDGAELERMIAEVDLDRRPLPEVAGEWIARRTAEWREWAAP